MNEWSLFYFQAAPQLCMSKKRNGFRNSQIIQKSLRYTCGYYSKLFSKWKLCTLQEKGNFSRNVNNLVPGWVLLSNHPAFLWMDFWEILFSCRGPMTMSRFFIPPLSASPLDLSNLCTSFISTKHLNHNPLRFLKKLSHHTCWGRNTHQAINLLLSPRVGCFQPGQKRISLPKIKHIDSHKNKLHFFWGGGVANLFIFSNETFSSSPPTFDQAETTQVNLTQML